VTERVDGMSGEFGCRFFCIGWRREGRKGEGLRGVCVRDDSYCGYVCLDNAVVAMFLCGQGIIGIVVLCPGPDAVFLSLSLSARWEIRDEMGCK
jgi:hypothetical protein